MTQNVLPFKCEIEKKAQGLTGMDNQKELPFPTLDMEKIHYKVFGIVTNMDLKGDKPLDWHHKRCGKSKKSPQHHERGSGRGQAAFRGFWRKCGMVEDDDPCV